MKLLDTTVAIDHLRGAEAAVELLRLLVGEGETLAASEVVRVELIAGVRDREVEALERFFSVLSWIPVNEDIARTAGLLARKHRKAHVGIDDADYVIAATAVVLDADVLTTNVRHFPMLAGLRAPY
ncbi:MAG: VapC toxin family PIN domain ribonuclease [Solirubrobacterales bacterium]|nr:MAG: VapC toxin family PIN domain ribonuclease [Solirubrobacterales bacterium]